MRERFFSDPAFRRAAARFTVYGLLIVSLSVAWYFQLAAIAVERNDTTISVFLSPKPGFETFREGFKQAWKPRALPIWAAYYTCGFNTGPMDLSVFAAKVAAWNAVWMGAAAAVLAWRRPGRLALIMGLFAALLYGYSPITGRYIYPWDAPAIFFFALAYLLYEKRKWPALVAVIALGTAFKETVILCGLLPLFVDGWTRRQRLTMAAVALGAGFLVKAGADLITHAGLFYTFEDYDNAKGVPRLVANAQELFIQGWNNALFINAGTLLAVLLLPASNSRMWAIKTLVTVLALGNASFGVLTEYRIFFEAIPLSLLYLVEWEQHPRPPDSGDHGSHG